MLMFFHIVCRSAAALVLLMATAATAQSARPVPVRVAPDTYMVQGVAALGSSANRNFISNAAFVVTRDSVVVIDALGSPVLAKELLEEIARITPKPVSHVVVTHYHPDHVYGLQGFKEAGATIPAVVLGATASVGYLSLREQFMTEPVPALVMLGFLLERQRQKYRH